ncbi:MAG: hypothetical protein ABSA53_20125 [Streptosporangiaceae bacterium]
MTGPEHYHEAGIGRGETIAAALVHATLALAAATALTADSPQDVQAWQRVAGADGVAGATG